MKPYYKKITNGRQFFCTVHNRPATHMLYREGFGPEPHCDPSLGGITMPCQTVEKQGNKNVTYLQDEILNTIERCRRECEDLTIAETIGVLEIIKLNLLDATFHKQDS